MILIAIGSNLNSSHFGSPEQNCKGAIGILGNYFNVAKSSSLYKTEPIPKSEQPWFVNCIVEIETNVRPTKVLEILFEVELQLGRQRNFKNESRVIDLDLISYNDLIIESPELKLPHPRMHLRKFVIQPLCDINKNWIHPILKKKAFQILKELANQKILNIS